MQGPTGARRISLLAALGALLGLMAGGAAWVLLGMIGLLTNLALFGRWEFEMPAMSTLDPSPRILIVAVLGALVVALLARWSPIIKGHGIPEAMESVLRKQSRVAPRTAVAKPLSAAIAIGTGGPFGAEGPIIVTGGSLGSLLGQFLDVSPSERKILLACGAAGGMAATFGAPIASIVLAIELLLFEFSTRAFIPLAVSVSVAGGVHVAIFGAGPLFTVPDHDFAGLAQLPWFVPLGLLCGLAAVVISKGLFVVEAGFRRLPIREFWHPVIGAVGFASIGLFVPEVLGVGYDVIDLILADELAVTGLALIVGAKLIAWWIALGSGTSGGTLAPVLLVSGGIGSLVGHATAVIAPDVGIEPGAFALVAMAATFGAATRATFTSIVFVFELTRDYNAILPLIFAAVLADLVAAWLLPDTLMTEKLRRRGVRVSTDMRADVLDVTLVEQVMTRTVATLDASATVDRAIARVARTGHSAFPVVEARALVGIVTRGDLLEGSVPSESRVVEVAKRDVVTITSGDSLSSAIDRMVSEGVDHLPVVDENGQMIGMCTRSDILMASHNVRMEEARQPGWRPRLSRSRTPSSPDIET